MFCPFCGAQKQDIGVFCVTCGKSAPILPQFPAVAQAAPPPKNKPHCGICHQVKSGHGLQCHNIPCEGSEFCGIARLHLARGKHKRTTLPVEPLLNALVPVSNAITVPVGASAAVKFQANGIYSTQTTEEIKTKVRAKAFQKQVETLRNQELMQEVIVWCGQKDQFFATETGLEYAKKIAARAVQMMVVTLKGYNKGTIPPLTSLDATHAPILLQKSDCDVQLQYSVEHPPSPSHLTPAILKEESLPTLSSHKRSLDEM
jgi:hypothetical protein